VSVSTRRRLLTSAVLLWVGLAVFATAAPLADWLVLPPRLAPPPEAEDQVRREFPFGAGRVEVWERRGERLAAGALPALRVLCFCGQGDRAQQKRWDVMDLVEGVPILFSTVNYPGYGGTTGPSRLSRLGPCAVAAFDAISDGKCPVLVSGYSLGAVSALYVAARRPVAGVVVVNPPALQEMFLGQGWWNLWSLALPAASAVPAELDTVKNAGDSKAPGVVITSAADEVVPYSLQRRVAEAYGGRKRVLITSRGHDLVLDERLKAEIRAQLRWLLRQGVTRDGRG